MKLLLNLSGNLSGGGLQVSLSLLEEFKAFNENDYYVVVNEKIFNIISDVVFPSNFKFFLLKKKPWFLRGLYLENFERKICPDVVFSPFGPVYWKPAAPHLVGFAIAHYLYPESLFWNGIHFFQNLFWKGKKRLHMYYFQHTK